MIDELIFHPEILFDWGQKSMHAYLDSRDEELQHFCDPETVDKGLIMNYINKYLIYLKRYISRNKKLRTSYDVNIKIEQLKTDINREENNERLLLINEWLIYAFHTMGVKEFAKISPCISCSCGEKRFDVAKKFGSHGGINPYYVIMDCWVNKCDEGTTFRRTEYVNQQLEKYRLKWFPNHNSEIMLKYAIFPQQLVGYYLIERGEIKKYVVNKHYLDEWKRDKSFFIGEPVYFEQNIDFNNLGPYNTVYEYYDGSYSVASRRYIVDRQ